MKIQIISKIVNNPARHKAVKETSLNKEYTPIISTHRGVEDQYFPQKELRNIKGPASTRLQKGEKHFFQQFQHKCAVIYQKVNREPVRAQRQLEPILTKISKQQKENQGVSEYEFSFKKKESTTSTLHTEQNQTPKQSQKYFYNRSQRPRLKKFNSLMTLRGDQTERGQARPSFQGQKIILRKNCSLMKCDQGSYLRSGAIMSKGSIVEEVRLSTDSEYCRGENNGAIQSQRVFAEQKDRLARIRRQLNQIYQMRRPQKLQLF